MDTTNPINANARAFSADLDIRITDSSLRDGSHHKRHQFTREDIVSVVGALDGGLQRLAAGGLDDLLRGVGVHDVTLTLYPGARHEILHETNRDEVVADILAWLDAHV